MAVGEETSSVIIHTFKKQTRSGKSFSEKSGIYNQRVTEIAPEPPPVLNFLRQKLPLFFLPFYSVPSPRRSAKHLGFQFQPAIHN